MGETLCFIIVECACFSSTPQMTSLHRHCHSRWLYLAIITILSEVAGWPAIPPLGDVATSALTRPTRRMCNQSTGHRGGQGVVPPAGFSPLRLTPDPPLLMDAQCQGHLQVAGCTLPLPPAVARCQLWGPFDRHHIGCCQCVIRGRNYIFIEASTNTNTDSHHRCCTFQLHLWRVEQGERGEQGAKWKTPMKIKARFRCAQIYTKKVLNIYIVYRPRWQF